jgi:hypothetical protein
MGVATIDRRLMMIVTVHLCPSTDGQRLQPPLTHVVVGNLKPSDTVELVVDCVSKGAAESRRGILTRNDRGTVIRLTDLRATLASSGVSDGEELLWTRDAERVVSPPRPRDLAPALRSTAAVTPRWDEDVHTSPRRAKSPTDRFGLYFTRMPARQMSPARSHDNHVRLSDGSDVTPLTFAEAKLAAEIHRLRSLT